MKTEDTGLYTCTASSESGETSWSASLSVENPKNPNIIFHKTPDPATFPQAPTKVNNFGQIIYAFSQFVCSASAKFVWAEWAILGSAKTALEFKREI